MASTSSSGQLETETGIGEPRTRRLKHAETNVDIRTSISDQFRTCSSLKSAKGSDYRG
jgi:hypothetical protein